MRVSRGRSRRGALTLAAILFAALPAHGLAPAGLEALARLEQGRWQLRDMDGGAEVQAICLRDPLILAQIEHQGAACAREVVESGPAGGTIRYTCPGRGFGHSILRVETPRLARIHTQGVKSNVPFDYRLEARRTGPC